jgi:hypothetical protein
MSVTPEQLAAYADGELDEVTEARVRRAVETDPELARQLAKLTELRGMLTARFDPILAEPVPERLTRQIEHAAKIVNLGDVRAARQKLWQRPQFRFAAGAAIAASLVVAVLVGGPRGTPQGYADTQLASALDGTLSSQTAPDGTRLLISFRDAHGGACRGYSGKSASGIACRDDKGWKLEMLGTAGLAQTTQYQQAGSADAAIMAAAQNMATGPALDAAAEETARKAGWQSER